MHGQRRRLVGIPRLLYKSLQRADPLPFQSYSQVLTGSYSNYFHIYDRNGRNDIVLQADKSAFKTKRVGAAKNKPPVVVGKKSTKKEDFQNNLESLDFTKKILHASWHPKESTVALAATNNLFLFQGN